MNPEVPQFEKFWRDKIANEIKNAISSSNINAYGAYLIALHGVVDD